jgi:nitrous oxide reductase accessory protein NosL
MLYGVEFGSFGGGVGAAISNMQTWFGNQRSQPVIFRQVAGHDGAILRLELRSAEEAAAFVGAFGGRLLQPEPKASAA